MRGVVGVVENGLNPWLDFLFFVEALDGGNDRIPHVRRANIAHTVEVVDLENCDQRHGPRIQRRGLHAAASRSPIVPATRKP
jgi:hypothetical protein